MPHDGDITQGRGAYVAFARAVLEGLSAGQKELPPWGHYDAEGARLFATITGQPEYPLTEIECRLLRNAAGVLAKEMKKSPFRLIELGVGDIRKASILMEAFQAEGCQYRYEPTDICAASVQVARFAMGRTDLRPSLGVGGLVGDHFEALRRCDDSLPSLVLFLGSSICNMNRADMQLFLARMRQALRPGDHVLLGFDLLKDVSILERAYNDARGITEEFNLNYLRRINAELGGKFDLSKFRRECFFNREERRIEAWLVSTCDQVVNVSKLGTSFVFKEEERILVELSTKLDLRDIDELTTRAGFTTVHQFLASDPTEAFLDGLYRV